MRTSLLCLPSGERKTDRGSLSIYREIRRNTQKLRPRMAAFETQAPEFGLTMLGELNAESSRKGKVPQATGTDN